MLFGKMMIGLLFLAANLTIAGGAEPGDCPVGVKYYCVAGGEADAETYNGFRRYHAACNHCHGPDGMGSTFAPSLIERLPDREAFRRVVLEGVESGPSVMKGFAGDPNVAPFVDDIYAYLQERADGSRAVGRDGSDTLEGNTVSPHNRLMAQLQERLPWHSSSRWVKFVTQGMRRVQCRKADLCATVCRSSIRPALWSKFHERHAFQEFETHAGREGRRR